VDILDLIDSRYIFFITGKGGTGKSTFTVVLSRISSKRYKTLIVDFDNKRSTIREILKNTNLSTEPSMIDNNLYFSHIEPEDALRFYLNDFLKSDFIINLAMNLKPLKSFYNALPSAKEMLITYFLLHLVNDFDFKKIFIDMPASGHAELFLKIPYSARGIFDRGPVIQIVKKMEESLYNKEKSGIIQMTLPEEVIISETIEFYHKFNSIQNMQVISTMVNKVYNMTETEVNYLDMVSNEDIKNLYAFYLSRFKEQRSLIAGLKKEVDGRIFEIPFFTGNNSAQSIFNYFQQV